MSLGLLVAGRGPRPDVDNSPSRLGAVKTREVISVRAYNRFLTLDVSFSMRSSRKCRRAYERLWDISLMRISHILRLGSNYTT